MKKNPGFIVISGFLAGVLLVLSLFINQKFHQRDLDRKAQVLIEKACGGNLKMTWQKRANLAAKANGINDNWERLYDAVLGMAASAEVLKSQKNWINATGNDGLSYNWEFSKSYAKYVAECNRLP
jgi:hypothetical protein